MVYYRFVIPCLSQHPGCLQHRSEALGMFGTLVDCCWETSFGYPLGRRKGVFQRVETKNQSNRFGGLLLARGKFISLKFEMVIILDFFLVVVQILV